MKIQVLFRDKPMATSRTDGDGSVAWDGPGAGQVRQIADFYAAQGHDGGEKLLKRMVARMQGLWQAVEVRED